MPVVPDSLTVVILAAGGGSRIGGGKLLLPWRDRPILAHTLAAAARVRGAREIIVVTGCDAPRVGQIVRDAVTPDMPPTRIVENTQWRDGQSTSLRLGIEAIMRGTEPDTQPSAMIMLGDQPTICPSTLNLLADRHADRLAENPGHHATVPLYNNQRGNPAILAPSLYPAVMRLDGDVGARHILAAPNTALLTVPVDDPGTLRDVDTPLDYQALRQDS